MSSANLEGITYPQRESSYMACALGAARYLGFGGSEAWLYGACGMAFFSHATSEGICWSYPTDWNADCLGLLRNAGLAPELVLPGNGDVKKAVKDLLAKGVPLSAWSGGIVDEQVLIYGYGDTAEGETVKYLFLNPVEKNTFHPWENLGPVAQYALVSPSDDRTTVKMGLQCAVDMNRNPRRFSPNPEMAMGYEAFRAMANWLGRKEELGGEFGYNIQVWEECRRNAVGFLKEANARLDEPGLRQLFLEAEQHTRSTHGELKAMLETFADAASKDTRRMRNICAKPMRRKRTPCNLLRPS